MMKDSGKTQEGDTEVGRERRLIGRCLKGEAEAWDELFQAHYTPAARFVFQLGYEFSCHDVEEICQEVFVSVIRNLRRFRGKSRLRSWIFRIASNKARDFCQKQRAAKRGGGRVDAPLRLVADEDGPALDPPATGAGPERLLMDAEHLDLIGRGLRQLADFEREIIEMRYFADLSYREIGASLDLNEKTVSSRLSRAVARLRERVQAMIRRPVAAGAVSGG